MNKPFYREHNRSEKISGILVFVLLASLLLPVLAFASTGFSDDANFSGSNVTDSVYSDTYGTGTVTGSVYSDTYGTDTVNASVYTFNDIQGHWAQSDIELLANKKIVEGTSANTFEPERNINRAEFAALVVRSLGLSVSSVVYNTYFTDVNSDDWYAGVVVAAKNAGLIDGFEDGTFQPNKEITREQLTALVVRALNFAGVKTDVTASEQTSLLAKYTDADSIVWAQEEVAAAIKAGIVNGLTDTTLAPGKNATRAESVTILKRLLTNAGLLK